MLNVIDYTMIKYVQRKNLFPNQNIVKWITHCSSIKGNMCTMLSQSWKENRKKNDYEYSRMVKTIWQTVLITWISEKTNECFAWIWREWGKHVFQVQPLRLTKFC